MKSLFIKRCVLFLEIVAVLSMVAPILGYLGKVYWVFDLFSHFRVQYIISFLLLGIFFLLCKRKVSSILCGILLLFLAVPLGGYFFPNAKAEVTHPLKVISFNIYLENRNYDGIRDFLLKEDADVVFLMEVNGSCCRALQELKTIYPYQILQPREDFYGVALFSKRPFVKEEIYSSNFGRAPILKAEIENGGIPYHLIAVHAECPMSALRTEARNDELLNIARSIPESHASNVLLMGDFNMTPFSPYFSEILKVGGLKNSMSGFGIAPSWMRDSLMAIPIDHLLLSENLYVTHRTLGDRYGSDHNPLIVELGMPSGK